MRASELKDILTTNDVLDLLSELGGDPKLIKGDNISSRTICHGGDSHKLVYYGDSKIFQCFTGCGETFDIYTLIEKIFGYEFIQAFRYVAGRFNVNTNVQRDPLDRVDTSFINKFKKKEDRYELTPIPKTLLNSFYQLYHKSWIDDGISVETMKKFDILFSIKDNKIVIPHFNIDGELLGIRGRALNKEEIDAGRKYMPMFHKGEVRKHPTGANIYGLNVTKEKIIKNKTIILFESEKSPQQLDTMWPEMSIGGAISGSNLTNEQVRIIRDMGVENVVIGMDKEFEEAGTEEELFYKKKIMSGFVYKLLPYFRVQILWDSFGILDLKDSPTDKGIEIFKFLWQNRITIK